MSQRPAPSSPALENAPAFAPRWRLPNGSSALSVPLLRGAAALLALVVAGVADTFLGKTNILTEGYFYLEDFAVAGAFIIFLGVLSVVPSWAVASREWPALWRRPALIGLAAGLFAWAGSRLVYDSFGLAMDEFMADFDARIFLAGHWVASIPEAWRDYAPALQPKFALYAPDNAAWISSYEPMNAALRALGARFGLASAVSPALAGLSIVATYGAARKLWPQQPQTALTAAILLATSSQFLVTAMTPYAMTAHLALNMTWLWLLLRGGRWGHGLAPVAAFVATGLHQIVFHPLFAAPFVLELWLARRWRAAAWHTCAYAAICAFWLLYPSLLAQHMASAAASGALTHDTNVLAQARGLVGVFDPAGLGLMVKNLLRLFTWQSLLCAPLAIAAVPAALKARGMERAMVVGLALTTAAMLVLLAYQGHGWGYRYLHGLLGTLCLLAAWTWSRMTAAAGPAAQGMARTIFAVAALASLLILLPIRLWQVHATVHPFAVATRTIQAMDADVVLVDSENLWFGIDLVRNDPFLTNRPLVMDAARLSPEQIQALRRRYVVRVFGVAEGDIF